MTRKARIVTSKGTMNARADGDKSPGSYLTADEKAQILTLHGENLGTHHIADQLGRSPSTITKFIRKYASTVKVARAYFEEAGPGSPHELGVA